MTLRFSLGEGTSAGVQFEDSLESIVLTLAFMALLRIKDPEQLKQCKPGEIGRIIGLDRVPEVKCLRSKLDLLTRQQQATHLNNIAFIQAAYLR